MRIWIENWLGYWRDFTVHPPRTRKGRIQLAGVAVAALVVFYVWYSIDQANSLDGVVGPGTNNCSLMEAYEQGADCG